MQGATTGSTIKDTGSDRRALPNKSDLHSTSEHEHMQQLRIVKEEIPTTGQLRGCIDPKHLNESIYCCIKTKLSGAKKLKRLRCFTCLLIT
ncbi:hypothetical protein DPMN_073870 [Dreissena polymorpha]|uniref:Uncharacterized protein n=1 Tax=Dreissena polymorpha TaxID=45954 RepID=A0A9D4BDK3_DREPO|nr:hypothetical protein DPMN_073870 [Dreissena polymorpha]